MIRHLNSQKVLMTNSLKKKIENGELLDDKKAFDALSIMLNTLPYSSVAEFIEFDLDEIESKIYVIELLRDYVNGGRGIIKTDENLENIYWLHIWMNGHLLLRMLKLSDSISFKIDLDEVVSLKGKVDKFTIGFKNGSQLDCNDNMRMY